MVVESWDVSESGPLLTPIAHTAIPPVGARLVILQIPVSACLWRSRPVAFWATKHWRRAGSIITSARCLCCICLFCLFFNLFLAHPDRSRCFDVSWYFMIFPYFCFFKIFFGLQIHAAAFLREESLRWTHFFHSIFCIFCMIFWEDSILGDAQPQALEKSFAELEAVGSTVVAGSCQP